MLQNHTQVPAHAEQNDLRLKMTPFERTMLVHEGNSSPVLEQKQSLPESWHFCNRTGKSDLACIVSRTWLGPKTYLYFVMVIAATLMLVKRQDSGSPSTLVKLAGLRWNSGEAK